MIGDKTIRSLDQQLSQNLKKELRDQGHYLTGALEQSVQSRFVSNSDGVTLEMVALDYINDLETGIPGNQIDVTDASYIEGLARYAKLRFGLKSDRQALRAAFRIAAKHRKEGMPTRNSYQFSSTGERTEAVQTSYDEHARDNEKLLEDTFSTELDELIDKTFDQTVF